MTDKEIAAELTKAYIQAYVRNVFVDEAVLSAKVKVIKVDRFTDAYKQFYDAISSIPDET